MKIISFASIRMRKKCHPCSCQTHDFQIFNTHWAKRSIALRGKNEFCAKEFNGFLHEIEFHRSESGCFLAKTVTDYLTPPLFQLPECDFS